MVALVQLQIFCCSDFFWIIRQTFCHGHCAAAGGISLACFGVYDKMYISHSFVLTCSSEVLEARWDEWELFCTASFL